MRLSPKHELPLDLVDEPAMIRPSVEPFADFRRGLDITGAPHSLNLLHKTNDVACVFHHMATNDVVKCAIAERQPFAVSDDERTVDDEFAPSFRVVEEIFVAEDIGADFWIVPAPDFQNQIIRPDKHQERRPKPQGLT